MDFFFGPKKLHQAGLARTRHSTRHGHGFSWIWTDFAFFFKGGENSGRTWLSKKPGCLGLFIGDDKNYPVMWDSNKPLKGSLLNNQDDQWKV